MKNKTQALERLTVLEAETKHLRRIIEAPDTSGKVTDRIKTFEDACNEVGELPNQILPFVHSLSDEQKALNATAKLFVIVRALNEGWQPDWTDTNECKYYPWFKMKSGVGFSHTYYVNWHSNTPVGSRLCFKSAELAEYAGKQFESIYKEFLGN